MGKSPTKVHANSVSSSEVEKQQAITKVLDATNHEITIIQAQLNFLRIQKRGLMQKLLTGKWRVAPEGVRR